jgi:hypothetical protein
MAFTATYIEIRENTDVKFWHETESVKSWWPEFEKKILESGKVISFSDTIIDNGTTHIREFVFDNDKDCDDTIGLSPVPNYQEIRRSYNTENNISFFATYQ